MNLHRYAQSTDEASFSVAEISEYILISAYFPRLTPRSLDYKNSVISQRPEIFDFKLVVIRIGALSYQKRDVKNIFHRMIN